MPLADALPAIAAYVVAVNAATFAAFAWDKHRARSGGWRVPERTLLSMAAVGGAIGALLAAQVLRHKSYKEPFRTQLRSIAALQLVALVVAGGVFVWLAVR